MKNNLFEDLIKEAEKFNGNVLEKIPSKLCSADTLCDPKTCLGDLEKIELTLFTIGNNLLNQGKQNEAVGYFKIALTHAFRRNKVEQHLVVGVGEDGMLYSGIHPTKPVMIDLNDPNQLLSSW